MTAVDTTLLADPDFLLTAFIAVFLFGIGKGGFIGVGVLALGVLSMRLPPQEAIAVTLPTLAVQGVLSAWIYRGDVDWWNLKVLVPGAAIGIMFGWYFAASLSVPGVRLIVGILGVTFVLSRMAGPRIERLLPKANAVTGTIFGGLAGFVSTLANAGAPLYHMFAIPQQMPTRRFVGTTTFFFCFVDVAKVPAYAALGAYTPPIVAAGLALLPFAVISNMIGVYLAGRLSGPIFYRIAYLLIFLLSFWQIYNGYQGLYG